MMAKYFAAAVLLLFIYTSFAVGALPVLPGSPGTGQVPAAAAATPDTALATLLLPENYPRPVFFTVVPDTVAFGGIATMVLDFPAGTDFGEGFGFIFEEEWVVPAEDNAPEDARELEKLPEPVGVRISLPVRIYRIWPFRISDGSAISSVIHVRGKVQNIQDLAPVRNPRLWGMNLTQLIIAGLVAICLLVLVSWLWHRRISLSPVMEPTSQGPIAWPAAAVRLAALESGGMLERGETRQYLCELARIARNYVAGRYFVGADEMTGKEIEAACLAQGYDLSAVRPFAQLVRRVDQLRYHPEQPMPGLCRDEFTSLVAMVNTVRISSEHTPIPAVDLISGQKAWAQLSPPAGGEKRGHHD